MPISQAEAERILAKVKGDAVVIADPVADLEASGWENWLRTIWPFWFSADFSQAHRDYWEVHFECVRSLKQKTSQKLDPKQWRRLLILGRGLGKSASLEAARLMFGAITNGGYSLMISETEDQAQEHLGNCRILIEHPESRLLEFYPQMAIAQDSDKIQGLPTADRREMFVCQNGYILRAKGLTSKMRGLRVGNQRPNDVSFDDIDDVIDSLAVSHSKLRTIGASILPVLARGETIVDFGQNLIIEHGVLNQILTGKSDLLTDRVVFGPMPAFTELNIETAVDPASGQVRHLISPDSVPSWDGLNVRQAQTFLHNSGLEIFKAEYQNDFSAQRSGYVIPEFSEERQVITWSMFESVFGERRIPAHWKAFCGVDIGYSVGTYPHWSAWTFVATAARNSPMPGAVFVYRSKTFQNTSIDDQAENVIASLWPKETIASWQMSHEKSGEMMTLRARYQLPFSKFKQFKSEDGVAQWRHLSRADRSRPNPFRDDRRTSDATDWELGAPNLYYIVDDDQLLLARDDRGMKLLRDQVATWEYVPVKLTDHGQTVQKPSKTNDDVCDSLRGILVLFGPQSADYSAAEKFERSLPATIQADNLAAVVNDPNVPQAEVDGLRQRRQIEVERARERETVSQIPVHQTRFRIL